MTTGGALFRRHFAFPAAERFGAADSALLVIDLQYFCGSADHGRLLHMRNNGLEEAVEYYLNELENRVIPNVAQLLKKARAFGMPVIHTKIESMTSDGRDRSPEHKRLGIHCAPGSIEATILPPVRPVEGEIVLSKTASGAFGSTNLDYILRNSGVEKLLVCGVTTNGCVESTVRPAADIGYYVALVGDACAAYTQDLHEKALGALSNVYAKHYTTEEALKAIVVERSSI